MTKDQIKAFALRSGFKLNKHPDGDEDLDPSIYAFAAALSEEAGRDGYLAGYSQGSSDAQFERLIDEDKKASKYAAKVKRFEV